MDELWQLVVERDHKLGNINSGHDAYDPKARGPTTGTQKRLRKGRRIHWVVARFSTRKSRVRLGRVMRDATVENRELWGLLRSSKILMGSPTLPSYVRDPPPPFYTPELRFVNTTH